MALGQEELGRLIKQARDEAGLTQPELAERIGLKHPQSISRYERGLNEVPQRRLHLIAEQTGKPMSFFVAEAATATWGEKRDEDASIHEELAELRGEVARLPELVAQEVARLLAERPAAPRRGRRRSA